MQRQVCAHSDHSLLATNPCPQRSSEELFAYHFYSFFLLAQENTLPSSTLSGFMPERLTWFCACLKIAVT